MSTGQYQVVPIEQLHESPLNPRKTFDPKTMEDLIASVRAKGVITPLLVRPRPDGLFEEDRKGRTRVREDLNGDPGFEIASGHRRYRAAKAAGLAEVPSVVRPMDDVTFLEVLIMENDEREDLHPLEEAQGYKTLMTRAGYSIELIAERRGCSVKYLYDRVKLLSLIPEAQALFREGRFTAGHAILLARLKPEDQKRALDPAEPALFEGEDSLWTIEDREQTAATSPKRSQRNRYDELKARSVRELEAWIAEHVRFKATEADPVLFPAATVAVATAVAAKEKVVEITHDSFVQDEAREGRTIRAGYWVRADGKQGSKVCDRAATGVIVVGPGQGDAFKVCVDRERCTVHWGKEIREREKRRAAPSTKTAPKRDTEPDWKREQKKRETERVRYEAVLPAIFKALAEKVKKAPATVRGPLGKILLDQVQGDDVGDFLPLGSSAEDLVRYLAFDALTERPDTWSGLKQFAQDLKPFGIDVKKIVDDAAPKPESAATKEPAAKKRRKKK